MKLGLLFMAALIWVAGCGKETPKGSSSGAPGSAEAISSPSTPQTEPAAVRPVVVNETGDLTLVLAQLTDAVRKYSVEKRRVPADLNEVIAAGYISGTPQVPAGKKYIINARREVELK